MTTVIEPLLNDRSAAAVLGISTRTLWTLKDTGKIPHISVGRSVKYDPADLRAWIQQQKQNGAK